MVKSLPKKVVKACLACGHTCEYPKTVFACQHCTACGSDRLWGDVESFPLVKKIFGKRDVT